MVGACQEKNNMGLSNRQGNPDNYDHTEFDLSWEMINLFRFPYTLTFPPIF